MDRHGSSEVLENWSSIVQGVTRRFRLGPELYGALGGVEGNISFNIV